MKKVLIYILIIQFSLNPIINLVAQEVPMQSSLIYNDQFEIPPLHELIAAAIAHNSLVNYRKTEIEVKEMNLISKRKYWTRNLGFQADTRYGTFDNFSTNGDGQSSSILTSTTKQFNYGLGVYLKIPLFDITNRKSQIKQAKHELEQAEYLAESQRDELRQLVIRTHQDALLKKKILQIYSQNYGSATVNMEMVEKEFKNGIIPITEYVRISDMTSRIQTEYEQSRSHFIVAKKLLENLVGFTFDKSVN